MFLLKRRTGGLKDSINLIENHTGNDMSDCSLNTRILLIHPLGYSSKNAKSDVSRMANIMPPLGLASISAYLTQQGIENDLLGVNNAPQAFDNICFYD